MNDQINVIVIYLDTKKCTFTTVKDHGSCDIQVKTDNNTNFNW